MERSDHMLMTDVKIQVPVGMENYISAKDEKSQMTRNALLLYPYINDLTISHGKAAEILGISKYELIDLPYFDQDIKEVEEEVQYWKQLGVCE